jgi:hypothetical protein
MINQPSTSKGGIPGSNLNMEPGIKKVTAVVLTAVLAGVVLLYNISSGLALFSFQQSNREKSGFLLIFALFSMKISTDSPFFLYKLFQDNFFINPISQILRQLQAG